jgi:excisionase family DNA binding protein
MANHTVAHKPRLLRLDEAARRLDVSVDTIRRHVRAGHLDAVRLGPTERYPLRIAEDALIEFLDVGRSPSAGPRLAERRAPVSEGQSTAQAHTGQKGERDAT